MSLHAVKKPWDVLNLRKPPLALLTVLDLQRTPQRGEVFKVNGEQREVSGLVNHRRQTMSHPQWGPGPARGKGMLLHGL